MSSSVDSQSVRLRPSTFVRVSTLQHKQTTYLVTTYHLPARGRLAWLSQITHCTLQFAIYKFDTCASVLCKLWTLRHACIQLLIFDLLHCSVCQVLCYLRVLCFLPVCFDWLIALFIGTVTPVLYQRLSMIVFGCTVATVQCLLWPFLW